MNTTSLVYDYSAYNNENSAVVLDDGSFCFVGAGRDLFGRSGEDYYLACGL